jgi:TatD DNase family protein
MIDTHCHLEQPAYDEDRDKIIEKCKQELRAIITCAPDPTHYNLTFGLVEKYRNFVFAIAGIHPDYVKRFTDGEVEQAMQTLKANKDKLVGIGETGLDYANVTEPEWRTKQQQMFARFIRFAKEIDKPIVVHLRTGTDKETANVFDDAFEILEREGAKRVQLHMFGARRLVEQAMDSGWYISMNAICLRSKSYSKVVRDTRMDKLMIETDAPWLHPSFDKEKRNDPTQLATVAERVAEIKKTTTDEIIAQTMKNTIEFFELKI